MSSGTVSPAPGGDICKADPGLPAPDEDGCQNRSRRARRARQRETAAYGINNRGQIVGEYVDHELNLHGFLLSDGVFTTVDPPDGINVSATGINYDARSWAASRAPAPAASLRDPALHRVRCSPG
jgi:probable HAF family extracellular repeat protein